MTDKKMQVISCTFNRAVGCLVWFPSTPTLSHSFGCSCSDGSIDEPAHTVPSYTPLFSLFYHFPSTTNPPPYTTPMQPPTGASATTCALPSLDLAPSDQLCLFDGHMIYNFHVTFQFLVTWCMPSCSRTNHTLSCCMVRHLLKFYLRWALCSLSWLSFIFNLPVLTV